MTKKYLFLNYFMFLPIITFSNCFSSPFIPSEYSPQSEIYHYPTPIGGKKTVEYIAIIQNIAHDQNFKYEKINSVQKNNATFEQTPTFRKLTIREKWDWEERHPDVPPPKEVQNGYVGNIKENNISRGPGLIITLNEYGGVRFFGESNDLSPLEYIVFVNKKFRKNISSDQKDLLIESAKSIWQAAEVKYQEMNMVKVY